MVRRCVSFALNDTMSILCLFTSLSIFFLSIGVLGDWAVSEQSTTAFWPFLPPRICGIVMIPSLSCVHIDRIMSVTRNCFLSAVVLLPLGFD